MAANDRSLRVSVDSAEITHDRGLISGMPDWSVGTSRGIERGVIFGVTVAIVDDDDEDDDEDDKPAVPVVLVVEMPCCGFDAERCWMAPPSVVSLELVEKMPKRLSKLVEPLVLAEDDRDSSCEDLRVASVSPAVADTGGGVVLEGALVAVAVEAIEVKWVVVAGVVVAAAAVWVGWWWW